jgi:quinol monooxygenase YgiN
VRATDAADHFVVIESWPSKEARLAHTLETDGYEEAVYSDATLEAVFRGLACT